MKNVDITIQNYLPEWEHIIREWNINIDIQIDDSLEFNASARYYKVEDKFIIIMNKGIFKRIYDFYHSVLTKDNLKFANFKSKLATSYNKLY